MRSAKSTSLPCSSSRLLRSFATFICRRFLEQTSVVPSPPFKICCLSGQDRLVVGGTKKTRIRFCHRRLKLRSNFTLSPARHHSVAFAPLVAELERHREDKQWEKQHFHHSHPELEQPTDNHHDSAPAHESQPEWEDFMDAEDFINDEDKFNVTSRLLLLFPKLDVNPTDSFISLHELTQWNLQQAQRETLHRSQREMDLRDKNRDGFVSFSEYDPPSWVQNADNDSFGYDMGWWKEENFNASVADEDGLLNLTEFNE